MRSRFAFDDTFELTTPIKLRDGSRGYIAGRSWNMQRCVQEYDARLSDNRLLRGLTAAEFSVVGQPRADLLRVA
jgi:hypothetical protein